MHHSHPNTCRRLVRWWGLVAACIAATAFGCSGDPVPGPTYNVELFGWAGGSQGGKFVRSLQDYPEAEEVQIALTQPRIDGSESGRLQKMSTHDLGSEQARLPKLSFGSDLRLEFQLLNDTGDPVAGGATPLFKSRASSSSKKFRVMIAPIRDFAPVGARFRPPGGDGWTYSTVSFDGPSDARLGRIGHATALLDDGRLLVTGGGQWTSTPQSPTDIPKLDKDFQDLQLFDPGDGYVTNISYEERRGEGKTDALGVGHVYHTVTKIGPKRFAVIGGLAREKGVTGPTRAIEIIDLKAEPGEQVKGFKNAQGKFVSLSTARLYHTATYLEESNQIVVIGGVDQTGKALSSVEVIDLEDKEVQPFDANAFDNVARAEHATVKVESGTGPKLWVLGGRNADEALKSTEVFNVDDGNLELQPAPNMNTARFDMAVQRLSQEEAPSRTAVIGGFTSIEGGGSPTKRCEIGSLSEQWRSANSWKLKNARGGAHAFELTQSSDLVVVGGQAAQGGFVPQAELLEFTPGQSSPYQARVGVGAMQTPRYSATATQLDNGMILLTGGFGRATSGGIVELDGLSYYNPGDFVEGNGGGEKESDSEEG